MLRFISQFAISGVKILGFQYISCYGLSALAVLNLSSFIISIHPMLRFIWEEDGMMTYACFISIHPMLRFIVWPEPTHGPADRFQYIPCYGLSELSPDAQLRLLNFNTSHVTVYPRIFRAGSKQTDQFQYIPCYGLSGRAKERFYL